MFEDLDGVDDDEGDDNGEDVEDLVMEESEAHPRRRHSPESVVDISTRSTPVGAIFFQVDEEFGAEEASLLPVVNCRKDEQLFSITRKF